MKSLETRIPQFYDVLDTENKQVRKIFNFVLNKAKKNGFLEIETSSVEIRDRYINATGVHFSKIFEVRRPKEGNTFVLQADLAMSMSRFVADFPSTIPHLKFIQLGKMYRDRIPNEEGYRREFKQILLGEWGTSSLFADAEVINLTYSCLKQVPNSKILYIEISNHNVFNSISEGLARKIRFEGIRNLESINLHELDKKLIYKAFEKENLNISDIEIIYKKIINNSVKIELEKMISIYKFLKEQYGINDKIKFSLNNLEGTGHYSGLHYRIYLEINGKNYLIGDGGRIDTLCTKFNAKKVIPAVCMGIGIQVIAQLITNKAEERVAILVEENSISKKWKMITKLKEILCKYDVSIIPKRCDKDKKYFKSIFYENFTFIFINDMNIEIRSKNKEFEAILRNLLNSTGFNTK